MINATLSAAIATSQRDLLYYSISIQDRADKSIVAACSICLIPHHVRGNITHLGDWMGAQFGCCCSSIRVGDFSLLGVTLSILHKFVSIGGQRHERKLTKAMYLHSNAGLHLFTYRPNRVFTNRSTIDRSSAKLIIPLANFLGINLKFSAINY